ncbi:MAG: hypothetical protein QW650_01045 [Thermofilum sp.]
MISLEYGRYTLKAVVGKDDLKRVLFYTTGAKRVRDYGAPPAILECCNIPRAVVEAVEEAHLKGADRSAELLAEFFWRAYEGYRMERIYEKIAIKNQRLGYLFTAMVKFHLDYKECVLRVFEDLAGCELAAYPVVAALHPHVLSFDVHCFIGAVPRTSDGTGMLKLTGTAAKASFFSAFERYLKYELSNFLGQKAVEVGRRLPQVQVLPPAQYFSKPAIELLEKLTRQGL